MEITPDMQSLLEKLDALDLTEGERTAFGQLIGVEGDEVEGFLEIEQTATYGLRVQGFNTGIVMEKMVVMGGATPRGDLGRGRVVDHKADD